MNQKMCEHENNLRIPHVCSFILLANKIKLYKCILQQEPMTTSFCLYFKFLMSVLSHEKVWRITM